MVPAQHSIERYPFCRCVDLDSLSLREVSLWTSQFRGGFANSASAVLVKNRSTSWHHEECTHDVLRMPGVKLPPQSKSLTISYN